MDYWVPGHELESLGDLVGKPSDQVAGEPVEVVGLEEFIQVDVQELEYNTLNTSYHVLPEHQVVNNVHDAVLLVAVFLTQHLQNLDLHQRLLVEPGFVPDNLQSAVLLGLIVFHQEHLAKASAAEYLDDLVPVGNVIEQLHFVVSSLVVKAIIESAVNFVLTFSCFDADAEDFVVPDNLGLFIFTQTTRKLW